MSSKTPYKIPSQYLKPDGTVNRRAAALAVVRELGTSTSLTQTNELLKYRFGFTLTPQWYGRLVRTVVRESEASHRSAAAASPRPAAAANPSAAAVVSPIVSKPSAAPQRSTADVLRIVRAAIDAAGSKAELRQILDFMS